MPNQQLVEYIKQQMQLGVPKESIKQTLTTSGWPDNDITDGFTALAPAAAPAQPQASAVSMPSSQPVTSDIFQPNPGFSAKKPETTFQSKVESYMPETKFTQPASSGGWKSFILPGIMGVLIVGLLGVAGYLYTQNTSLTGDISKKSLSNNDLAVQLSAATQEKTNLAGDIAKLQEQLTDANSHLMALLPATGTTSTAPVELAIRGTLKGDDKTPYTLTTSRGLVLAIKNYKLSNVMSALKPSLGLSVLLGGTSVAGSKELVVKSVNGTAIAEQALTASSTTSTAPEASTSSTPAKPIMP